jgi:hypothetical protein
MLARILAGPALAVAILVTVAPAARADFALVSQDLTLSKKDDVAQFSLTFNQAPDFTTVDSLGRPANSFQVEFDGAIDPATALPTDLTAVVRGDEIHVADTVRIRAPTGDGGANSGGWGPIVGAVPFSLTGSTVSFTVPLEDLGWTGGEWQANVFSLSYGDLTAQQTVSSIPAPPAFWGGLAGLAVVAGLSVRRSMLQRRLAKAYLVG